MLCWLIYRFLFESKIEPRIGRIIIMSIYIVSLVLPGLIMLIPVAEQPAESAVDLTLLLGTVSATDPGLSVSSRTVDMFSILKWIYFIGLVTISVVFLINQYRLIVLCRKSEKLELEKGRVYLHSNRVLASFSWFNRIFLYRKSLEESVKIKEILLLHENSHVRLCHWIDLLVSQIFIIFQWFNPAAWLLRNELQRVHEYQADSCVLSAGIAPEDYQMLLISHISHRRFAVMTNGLNDCSLKKRIFMMERKSFAPRKWIRVSFLMLAIILSGFVLHNRAVASGLGARIVKTGQTVPDEIKVVSVKTVQREQADSMLIGRVTRDSLNNINEARLTNHDLSSFSWSVDGRAAQWENVEPILIPDNIDSITVLSADENSQGSIIVKLKDGTELKALINMPAHSETENKSSVQPVATYEGGESQLFKDLTESVRYPYEGLNLGVEKRVLVGFVVGVDGEARDFRIVESGGEIFDNAALDGVRKLPGKWTPGYYDGHPVESDFIIPINFKVAPVKKVS